MATTEQIINGKLAVEEYRTEERAIGLGLSEETDNVNILNKLKLELSVLGFPDLDSFFKEDKILLISEKRAALNGQKFRHIELTGTDIYNLLPTIEAVILCREADESPNTILSFYLNGTYVLSGQEGHPTKEQIQECKKREIPLIRSMTCGGIGIMTDYPQWISITKDAYVNSGNAKDVELDVQLDILKTLGLDCVKSMPNDIMVNGKKIGANAWKTMGSTIQVSNGIMYDFDFPFAEILMESDLSVKLATVNSIIGGTKPTWDKMWERIEQSYSKILGITLTSGSLTAEEVILRDTLRKKYLTDSWMMG